MRTYPTKRKAIITAKAILFCIVFTLMMVAFTYIKSFFPASFERITHGVLGILAAGITTLLFVQADRTTFAAIGFQFHRNTLKKWALGIVVGVACMGLIELAVILTSGFQIMPNPKSNVLQFALLTLPLLPLALMEEMAFRGYPLAVLKKNYGTRGLVLITSLLFALYHIANGWSMQNALLGAGSWGIVFGIAAIYSNGIAMSTGLHYGVNLATSAFAIDDSSFNLWILRDQVGQSLEHYQSSTLQTLWPQLLVLMAGWTLTELYIRRKLTSHLP